MNSECKANPARGREAEMGAFPRYGVLSAHMHASRSDWGHAASPAASGLQAFAMQSAHAPSDAARATSAPWVVHIVDDDDAVCGSLKFTFELDGFDVRTYAGFHELMASDLPRHGCMIVDYNLPEMNGLELLRELDRRNVHLPSFLITSNPSATVRQRADAQGVSIIEKPLLGNQLSEAVRDSFARTPS